MYGEVNDVDNSSLSKTHTVGRRGWSLQKNVKLNGTVRDKPMVSQGAIGNQRRKTGYTYVC